MRFLTLVLLATAAASAEPETWRPAEHPAEIVNRVHGVTRPARSLELASEVAGRVVELPLAEGAVVPDAGDGWSPALRIDDGLVAAERAAAVAAVAEAEAAVATARGELAIARREADHLAAELTRTETLVADERLSRRELDRARFEAERAQLTVEAGAARLAAAAAAVDSAAAGLAQVDERRARHTVHAPAGWVVAERLVEPGAVVQPGSPLLRLHDVSTLEIALRLDEAEIAALGAGASVTLRFPAFDTSAEARLTRIDLGFDPASRKRLVLLRLAGEDAPVASGGLVAVVELRVPLAVGAVLVPSGFLVRGRERSYVELADGSRRAVVPLREHDGMVVLAADALEPDTVLHRPTGAPR